ncbi:DoxX-like family protein [Lacinutrix chionoecetis]
MKKLVLHSIITIIIASVWLINGLYCKILNQVPRHETIVAHIFNTEHSRPIIIVIGFLEVCLAIWILTGYKKQLNAIIQIAIVIAMNIIEFIVVPELLMWQRLNIVFALMFVILVYLNAFYLNNKEINHYATKT